MKIKLIKEGGYFKNPEQMKNKLAKDASTSNVQKIASLAINQEKMIVPEILKDVIDFISEHKNSIKIPGLDIKSISRSYNSIFPSLMFGHDINGLFSLERLRYSLNRHISCDLLFEHNYSIDPDKKIITVDTYVPGGLVFLQDANGTRNAVDIFNNEKYYGNPQLTFGAWYSSYGWVCDNYRTLITYTVTDLAQNLRDNLRKILKVYEEFILNNRTLPQQKKDEECRKIDILRSYDFVVHKINLGKEKTSDCISFEYESPWNDTLSYDSNLLQKFTNNIFSYDNFDGVEFKNYKTI